MIRFLGFRISLPTVATSLQDNVIFCYFHQWQKAKIKDHLKGIDVYQYSLKNNLSVLPAHFPVLLPSSQAAILNIFHSKIVSE